MAIVFTPTVTASEIKNRAYEKGITLCGIASVDRFHEAPPGFHPSTILPRARSVIVLALQWPEGTTRTKSQAVYTFARTHLANVIDDIAFQITYGLENAGYISAPMPSNDPYDFWDTEHRHGHGVLSLRHAGVHAGMGRLGKNTLLINEHYGNMLWLSAIITTAELQADPLATYDVCLQGCSLCLDSCPSGALDGTTNEQLKCRTYASKNTEGGGFVYNCNTCRLVCPNARGI